jgi:ankyrin repeat protein
MYIHTAYIHTAVYIHIYAHTHVYIYTYTYIYVGNPRLLEATPIHYAAMGDHVEAIHKLVEAGGDPKACNRWNGRPLHYAAFMGSRNVV